jgi:anti-sigma regulatory factor (Ser/Thr protein kinase)
VSSAALAIEIGTGPLRPIRDAIREGAGGAGLSQAKVDSLVLAVSEAVTNTIVHGAATGRLFFWQDADQLICEVRNKGHNADPEVGRVQPEPEQIGGRGLWLMHQLCDDVLLWTEGDEQIVRLCMER